MDYKDTLNLPETDFPMRANLKQMEPEILKKWDNLKIYDKTKQKNSAQAVYTLHDGPPYANGRIHIGHALNKILKDVVIRYQIMQGRYCRMIPGWDCHGLPVELQLLKELKVNKDEIDQLEFRRQAADYALRYVGMQRDDFIRLGCWADWKDPYLTLNHSYEAGMLEVLARLVRQGYVYRGLRPVNWCVYCHTALAEAEVEYAEKESDSIFIRFRLDNADARNVLGVEDVDIIVWTTTPWTLLSNVAVAFNPSLDYVLVENDQGRFVCAQSLLEVLQKRFLGDVKVLKVFKAGILERRHARHPFLDREALLVLADYVSAEDGSGCVHIAPGHGDEDFRVGKQYKLDIIMPIDDRGVFRDVGKFSGIHVTKMNDVVLEELKKSGTLLLATKIRHSYPHCWRCKNPLMFRTTEQWFFDVEHDGLRERILEHVQKSVRWVPAQGRDRFYAMMANRPDWCLSRQRLWGVPIPALICKDCGKVVLDAGFIEYLSRLVREYGSNVYFERSISELLPQGFSCGCGGREFDKGTDILDVWFESGVSFYSVLKQSDGVEFPADLYLEGSDQHRGWFQVSMINAAATEGIPPYKTVLTHGFVVDGEGRKMSKSMGNVVAPQEVIDKYGAEILRLWTVFSDYRDEVRISDEILRQLADAYRKIRNTLRFMLGNLHGFTPDQLVLDDQLRPVDRYILSRLAELSENVTKYYDSFLFYRIYHDVYDFCNITLSSFYLDIMKDKLYTYSAKSKHRLSVQTVLWYCTDFLIKAIAPFLSFTAEQAYSSFCDGTDSESVFLTRWPDCRRYRDPELESEFGRLMGMRESVYKAMEEKRTAGEIGSSLEAHVIVTVADDTEYELLSRRIEELTEIFIVSSVSIEKGPVRQVSVVRAEGDKCPRCWNVRADIGIDQQFSDVCGRCAEALRDLERPGRLTV
jgi:isoleucyl-tRNA synthetase